MDWIGTAMGLVTIPMALLTASSLVAGGGLLALGCWQPVVTGIVAFLVCFLLTGPLERLIILIDDAAALTLDAHKQFRARLIAGLSASLPVMLILAWCYGCFRMFGSQDPKWWGLWWLWSYGVATGPWTVIATRVSRFRRTLCGIRAYACHLAYALLSLLCFLAMPVPLAIAAALVPMVLPLSVGMLLALADRDALTNVRV